MAPFDLVLLFAYLSGLQAKRIASKSNLKVSDLKELNNKDKVQMFQQLQTEKDTLKVRLEVAEKSHYYYHDFYTPTTTTTTTIPPEACPCCCIPGTSKDFCAYAQPEGTCPP